MNLIQKDDYVALYYGYSIFKVDEKICLETIYKALDDIKFLPTIFLLIISISLFYVGMGRVSDHFFKDSMLFRFIRYFILNFIIIYTVPFLSLVVLGEKENPA